MLTRHDLYTLRVILQKGWIDPHQLKQTVASRPSSSPPLSQSLIQGNQITRDQWNAAWSEAQVMPQWPESTHQRNLDNRMVYERLQKSGAVPPSTLQQMATQITQPSPGERAPRLHEILIQQGQITSSHIQMYLGILAPAQMACPGCNYHFYLDQFLPWVKYPCPICGGTLQRSISERDETLPSEVSPETMVTQVGEGNSSHQSSSPQGDRYFGKYKILQKIGEGGMGAVYKAYDTTINRMVALKMVLTDDQSREDTAAMVKRFYQEASLSGKLTHPFIVPLYDVGEIDGKPYFTMGYVEGTNLRDYVEEKGKFTQKKALEIMEKLCRAVFYAHEQGVVHRDIKPENIMIDDKGNPHLMDFGIAKDVRQKGETRLTKTGAIVGSPEFMSPEQALGERDVAYPADIYALGGTLYYMLSSRPPFSGRDVVTLLQQVVDKTAPSVRHYNRLVHSDVDVIVQKCLSKRPTDRYRNAGVLLYDVQAALKGDPILAQPPGAIQKLVRWIDRNRALAGVTVGAMILITVSMALWIRTLQGKIEVDASLRELRDRRASMEKKLRNMAAKEEAMNQLLEDLYEKTKKQRELREKLVAKNKSLEEKAEKEEEKAKNLALERKIESHLVHVQYTLSKTGNLHQAIEGVKRILAFGSDHKKNLLLYTIGTYYTRLGKYDLAYKYYKKSFALGDFPESLHGFTQLCLITRRFKEGLEASQRFVDKRSHNVLIGQIYGYRAQIYLRLQQPGRALEEVKKGTKAVQNLPRTTATIKRREMRHLHDARIVIHFNLAQIAQRQGQTAQAKTHYRRVLQSPRGTRQTKKFIQLARQKLKALGG